MIQRLIFSHVRAALADSPVVLLHGARQTGKSTLVQHLAAIGWPARYLTLDDANVLTAATTDPAGFLAGLDGPVALDEIQRAPGLFIALKAQVDRNRQPGRYLLTGSANVLMLPKLSESLAGRMEILPLWPLAQSELSAAPTCFVDELFAPQIRSTAAVAETDGDVAALLLHGGYPEAQRRPVWSRRRAWFNAYVTTILQRDVRNLASIDGLTVLPRLLALLAARTGALMNHAELARSTGLPQTTLKRYLALLEATFLVVLLPPWSGNLGKRLVKSPKVYLNDTGLSAALLGMDSAPALRQANLYGPLLENYVVMELRKQASWSQTEPALFHFRTQNGSEVDIVLESPAGALVGLEVKASSTVTASDFNGLRILAEETGPRFHRGIVLYQGSEVIPFGPKLLAVPITRLWQ